MNLLRFVCPYQTVDKRKERIKAVTELNNKKRSRKVIIVDCIS